MIQEAVFSQAATLVCGIQTFDWSLIDSFVHWNNNGKWLAKIPYIVTLRLKWRRRRSQDFDPFFDMPDSMELEKARHCEATVPRDKVYALLPFLRPHEIILVPDYTRSTKEVFIDCAIEMMRTKKHKVLQSVQSQPRTPDLSSWVPDWAAPPTRFPVLLGCSEPGWGQFPIPEGDDCVPTINYRADNTATASQLTSISVLGVAGHCFGSIETLGSTYIAGKTSFPAHAWADLMKDQSPVFASMQWSRNFC